MGRDSWQGKILVRPQRKPVEIFSFSFLDVIACAVGVILFITILAISNTVKTGDPELIRQLEEAMSTEATLERMKGQLAENQQKQQEMQQAKDRLTKLEAQVQSVSAQDNLATQYQELREQYAIARRELEQTNALGSIMPNRSPVARSTNKKPVVYLAFSGNDQVRIATQLSGKFQSDYYAIRETGTETILEAKGAAASASQLTASDGELAEILAHLDKARHYIECYVEPDAFEDFVKMRAALQAAGWDVGYMFNKSTSTLLYSYTGRTSKVQ